MGGWSCSPDLRPGSSQGEGVGEDVWLCVFLCMLVLMCVCTLQLKSVKHLYCVKWINSHCLDIRIKEQQDRCGTWYDLTGGYHKKEDEKFGLFLRKNVIGREEKISGKLKDCWYLFDSIYLTALLFMKSNPLDDPSAVMNVKIHPSNFKDQHMRVIFLLFFIETPVKQHHESSKGCFCSD